MRKNNLMCMFNQMFGKYMEDTATSKNFGYVILNGIHFYGSKPQLITKTGCLKRMVTHVTLLDEQLSAQEEFLAEWHSPIMLATPATLSRLAPTSSILSQGERSSGQGQVLLIIVTWLSGNLEQRHGGVTRNFAGTLFAIRYRNCLVWRHRVFQSNRNSD